MNRLGEAGAPGKLEAVLAGFPDVLQAAHAIAGAIGGVHHSAVNSGILKGGVHLSAGAEVQLVIAVAAFSGELGFRRAIDGRSLGASRLAERNLAVYEGKLLVVSRFLVKVSVGVRAGGCQGIRAFDLGVLGPIDAGSGIRHLYGEGHARDLGTVLGMVGAGSKAALGLVLRGGSEYVNLGAVVRGLAGVEVAVRDVHQHVVANFRSNLHQGIDGGLQMLNLLGSGRLGEVLFSKKILSLGKLGLDSRLSPRLLRVATLVQCCRLVVEILKLLLSFLAHRLSGLRDVVGSCLKVIAVVLVTKRMNGKGPIAGAIRIRRQLATRRLG